jgi:hypothetical protein
VSPILIFVPRFLPICNCIQVKPLKYLWPNLFLDISRKNCFLNTGLQRKTFLHSYRLSLTFLLLTTCSHLSKCKCGPLPILGTLAGILSAIHNMYQIWKRTCSIPWRQPVGKCWKVKYMLAWMAKHVKDLFQ